MNQIALIICFTLCTSVSFAQDNKSTKGERHSNVEKIAQELADPNSPIASLNFKNTFVQYTGDLPDAKKTKWL